MESGIKNRESGVWNRECRNVRAYILLSNHVQCTIIIQRYKIHSGASSFEHHHRNHCWIILLWCINKRRVFHSSSSFSSSYITCTMYILHSTRNRVHVFVCWLYFWNKICVLFISFCSSTLSTEEGKFNIKFHSRLMEWWNGIGGWMR